MSERREPSVNFNEEGIQICPTCKRPVTDKSSGCNNCLHSAYRGENPFEPSLESGYKPPVPEEKTEKSK